MVQICLKTCLRPASPGKRNFPSSLRAPSQGANFSNYSVHIFSDASERAYTVVGYFCTEYATEEVQVAFLAARSRVASTKQLSIPRLEHCDALTEAQLAVVLKKELTLEIHDFIYWTNSTTFLTWLNTRCLLEQEFPKSKN